MLVGALIMFCYSRFIFFDSGILTDWQLRVEVHPITIDIFLHHVLTHNIQILGGISVEGAVLEI